MEYKFYLMIFCRSDKFYEMVLEKTTILLRVVCK